MKQVLAVLLAIVLVLGLVGCSSAPAKEISITEPLKTLGETVENGIQTTAPNSESTTNPTSVPPTTKPTSVPPTTKPTSVPTTKPTSVPTTKPTSAPTTKPTSAPTTKPTSAPTTKPTSAPTTEPTSVSTTEPIHSHSYVETVIKQATCTENGITQYTCSCGDSYTEAIPGARGHNWANATCISPKTCRNCGATEGDISESTHYISSGGQCTWCAKNVFTIGVAASGKVITIENCVVNISYVGHNVSYSGGKATVTVHYKATISLVPSAASNPTPLIGFHINLYTYGVGQPRKLISQRSDFVQGKEGTTIYGDCSFSSLTAGEYHVEYGK